MQKITYTVHETAKVLNVGLNKAYELIQERKIPSVRVGRRIIIPKYALVKWLNESAKVGME